MHAVIYTRFSPRRNAKESESCETQEAICREYAAKQPWPVRAVYADKDMSGSDADRPGMAEAVAALRKGDVLLVYKRDRLARNLLLAELLRRQVATVGATIAAVSGDIAGDDADPTVLFIRQIMDAVAELERKQIAARTRDSMRQLQKKGRRMGRYAPYGWKLDPEDPANMLPVSEERAAMQRVYQLAEAGHNVAVIVRILNNEYPNTCRGKKWRQSSVMRILRRLDVRA